MTHSYCRNLQTKHTPTSGSLPSVTVNPFILTAIIFYSHNSNYIFLKTINPKTFRMYCKFHTIKNSFFPKLWPMLFIEWCLIRCVSQPHLLQLQKLWLKKNSYHSGPVGCTQMNHTYYHTSVRVSTAGFVLGKSNPYLQRPPDNPQKSQNPQFWHLKIKWLFKKIIIWLIPLQSLTCISSDMLCCIGTNFYQNLSKFWASRGMTFGGGRIWGFSCPKQSHVN